MYFNQLSTDYGFINYCIINAPNGEKTLSKENLHLAYEPRSEKTGFLHMRKQRCRSALISAFVFATRIVQSLYFLNPKFQASSHLVWLYSLVCVGHGQKHRRPVFSQRGSYICEQRHKSACASTQFDFQSLDMSLAVRKPVFGISDQVPHKPGCTATEDG